MDRVETRVEFLPRTIPFLDYTHEQLAAALMAQTLASFPERTKVFRSIRHQAFDPKELELDGEEKKQWEEAIADSVNRIGELVELVIKVNECLYQRFWEPSVRMLLVEPKSLADIYILVDEVGVNPENITVLDSNPQLEKDFRKIEQQYLVGHEPVKFVVEPDMKEFISGAAYAMDHQYDFVMACNTPVETVTRLIRTVLKGHLLLDQGALLFTTTSKIIDPSKQSVSALGLQGWDDEAIVDFLFRELETRRVSAQEFGYPVGDQPLMMHLSKLLREEGGGDVTFEDVGHALVTTPRYHKP